MEGVLLAERRTSNRLWIILDRTERTKKVFECLKECPRVRSSYPGGVWNLHDESSPNWHHHTVEEKHILLAHWTSVRGYEMEAVVTVDGFNSM